MRHPWLGPLFVILLCLLLALVYLHALHDGQSMGNELGELCLGITMMLGVVLLVRLRVRAPLVPVLVRAERAPPPAPAARLPRRSTPTVVLTSLPLRL